MLIWRGNGILVVVFIFVWAVIAFGGSAFVAEMMFPDSVISFSMTLLTTPVFGIFGTLSALALGFVTWRLGKKFNNQVNVHTLFFIPMQFWAFAFGLLALISFFMLFSTGVSVAKADFVDQCTDHEANWDRQACTCLANAIEDNTREEAHMPFYLYMSKLWDDPDGGDDAITVFFETEAMSLAESDRLELERSLINGVVCNEPASSK